MVQAELGPNKLGEPLGTYAIGYLDAARVVFQYANDGRGLVDLYFYPAAMNLRHGVELLAKQCCDYVAYEARDAGLLYAPGHSLSDAWRRAAGLIKDILSGGSASVDVAGLLAHVEFVDDLVDRLQQLDPKGTLLRYPEDVGVRWIAGKRTRGDRREDTHVPFNSVDLAEWVDLAERAVVAAQALDAHLGERSSFLQMQRNDPPARLADLVTGAVSDEQRELWVGRSKPFEPG